MISHAHLPDDDKHYDKMLHSSLSDETLLTNVMCGILSGVISSSIANPTDVLKVAICFADSAIVLPLLVGVEKQRDKGGSAKYVESLSNM